MPFVSIIMPIRNESGLIGRSLGAVLSQDYPPDRIEVIVVDGQSTDGTRGVVKDLIREVSGCNIFLVDNPGCIFSTGFNIGLCHAKGEVIIMLGGHTAIEPDYVRRCVEHLEFRQDVECVGGFVRTDTETYLGRTIALAMGSSFGVGGVAFRTKPDRLMEVDTVAFGAYRRSTFTRCGLMDEEMLRNQDDEFNYRLLEKGGRILLTPDIRSRYSSRRSLRSLWWQYFQYGYWKVRVMQKHPRQMRLRHFVPLIFVTGMLGSALLALFALSGRVMFALVAGMYLVANLAVSVWITSRKNWLYFPVLPLVFAILHFGYGFGFLSGLVKFANRWRDKHSKVPAREAING